MRHGETSAQTGGPSYANPPCEDQWEGGRPNRDCLIAGRSVISTFAHKCVWSNVAHGPESMSFMDYDLKEKALVHVLFHGSGRLMEVSVVF